MLHVPAPLPLAPADEEEADRLAALRRRRHAGRAGARRPGARAATLAAVPTATINLFEEAEQHSYVTHGFDTGSCPREDAMCDVALRECGPLHVPDASVDPRFTRTRGWTGGSLPSVATPPRR